MLNNFQKYVRNFIIQVGNHKISPNRLEIVHNDYYDFRSMYGKILFSSYRDHPIGDVVNEFGIPRDCISKFQKNRYCIDCEAYVRGEKMLEERMDRIEEKLELLLDKMDADCCCEIPTEEEEDDPIPLEYSAEALVGAIMDIGRSMYSTSDDTDFVIALIRLGLEGEYYPIIRVEDRVICLAFNEYAPDRREELAQKLGIISSIFSPAVCGPECTVLLIDCEKQHLRAKNYKIGVGEWLIH